MVSDPPEKREDGLTVLVRGRNHRAFLPRALRSALDALGCLEGEGFFGEILVIDDYSLDGSQKLLRSVQALYDEPRLRVLCLGERLGPAGLRGLGLRESAFRYVCVMDADDEIVPENLPLFLRSINETGAAMVYGNLIDKEDGEVKGVRSNMPAVPGLAKARNVDSFSILDTQKTSNLEATAEADHRDPEGWETALRLLAGEESVVFVPVVLGYRHGRSMSASGKLRDTGADLTTPRRRDRSAARNRNDGKTGRTYHPDVGFLDG